uniref:cysteine desulfurase n=1 Tax=Stylophora pistillata TaxID=50429 RepID=A0A2B4R443_STYPI
MMTLSAHKVGGPTGIGALIIKEGLPCAPLLEGGGQQKGYRSGTENVLGAVGFAAAFLQDSVANWQGIKTLRDHMENALCAKGAKVEGHSVDRLPNTSCLRMPGVSASSQVMAFDLKGIAVSAGPACSSGKISASFVLKAMGIDADDTIRESGVVYFDYQSTTPCDQRVVDVMLPYFATHFGNPHSKSHAYGWQSEAAVEGARLSIAQLIGASPKDIIFTSGATEANNLAIKGVAKFYQEQKNHIITCVTEHKCVLNSCRDLEQEGFNVTYLPVQQNGLIDLEQLKKAITPKTCLVSIMMANNEIGVIQSVADIGRICRKAGVFFHTDAAQAVGKIRIDVDEMNIDLLSLSGHKMYGPKGIGILYVRRRPRVRLKALISGGGQERGMRSGTLPTPLCIGLGKAAEIAMSEMDQESERLLKLRQYMWQKLQDELPDIYLNGDEEHRLPGSLNVSFAYVEGEGLMMGLKDLAVSSGSACTSSSLEPSYVLRAIGVGEDLAHTSIRFGLGRHTTQEEIDFAIKRVVEEVRRLREMSPLWEMAQKGVDLSSVQWSGH